MATSHKKNNVKKNLGFIFLLFISTFSKAQLSFPSGTYFPVGSGPTSICSADFNNDGKIDFATGNTSSNNISIRLGNGAGGFGATTNISSGVGINAIISADFNNDNKKDLAYINPNLYGISIRLGNGLGGFGAASANISVGVGPNALTSADFNNDGKMDIATCNSNTVSLLIGNGLGGFGAITNYSVGNQASSIINADFNNDGNKDIATANFNSNSLSVLLGNGLGGFSTITNFTTPSGPTSVISADFNGDNLLDLVSANYDYSNIAILLGNGLGSFGAATAFGTGSYPLSIANADFNGDGKMDVATANPFADSISVLLGNGLGAFLPAVHVAIFSWPYAILTADFNGDGVKDIATANYLTDNVCVLLNNTSFPIIANAGPHGSISPSGSTSVGIGGNQTYAITANNCYHISNVVVDGQSLGPISTYTFSTVLSTHTITATFASDSIASSSNANACTSYMWVENGNAVYTASGIYSQTFTTLSGCDSVHTIHVTIGIGCNTILHLNVYLQGYYLNAGLMMPTLFNAGLSSTSTLTDSLFVYLHDATFPYAVVATAAALLHTNGTATCTFSSLAGNYYIAIKHRNSIETWSANPVTISATTNYNFTNAANKAYGSNQIEVEPGIFAFYSGDINQDENIDLDDFSLLELDINNFEFGYKATDINGDGSVDLQDVPLLELNSNQFIFSIHP